MLVFFMLIAVIGLIGLIAMIYLCLDIVACSNSGRNRLFYSGSLAVFFYIFPAYLQFKNDITIDWMLFVFYCPFVAFVFCILIKQCYKRNQNNGK
jgi:hypothetical protein